MRTPTAFSLTPAIRYLENEARLVVLRAKDDTYTRRMYDLLPGTPYESEWTEDVAEFDPLYPQWDCPANTENHDLDKEEEFL